MLQGATHVISPHPCLDFGLLVKEALHQQDLAESFDSELSPPSSPTLAPALNDRDMSDSPLSTPEDPPPPSTQRDVPVTSSKVQLPRKPNPPVKLRFEPTSGKEKISGKGKPLHRKARTNKTSYLSRSRKRETQRDATNAHYKLRQNSRMKHIDGTEAVPTAFDTDKAPVAKSAYVALDRASGSKKTFSLEDLVGEDSKCGFKLQKWDGRTPMALLDKSKRVVAVLAGRPDDKDWPLLQAEAADALEDRRSRCFVSRKHCDRGPRRGAFIALPCGVSHGGGQKLPGNLLQDPRNELVLEELNAMKPFKRLAGFASSVMANWAPDLHVYYKANIDCLHCKYPSLVRVFPSSIFSAVSYNFGPRTVCYKHKDYANLAFGWCAVTALGYFDYTKGGHLVLWDLGLVVEFPPGSTILLPSALVAHSNTAIGKYERRYSFAQYSAGGLFRWVENGFKSREDYLASLSDEELATDAQKEAKRWEYGLSLLPIVTTA